MTHTSSIRLLPFLITGLAATGCEHDKKHTETAVLQVTHPSRKDTQLATRYVAQIRASQHIELRALERGYLERVFVDEGQQVKRGQRMFQILPSLYQAELKKAQAEADFAQLEFQNTKILADRKVVSPNELALSNAKLSKANAELALARVHRDFTEVRAPFDGIMGRLNVRLGSLVPEDELLTTLSDNTTMWVYFNVAEAEYLDYRSRVARGDEAVVKLVMANGKYFEHDGRISAIEADFDNETGTIAFRATFSNPEQLLRHGETGSVEMTHVRTNALLIPQKSTFEVLDKRFVYVVDAKAVVHARQISVSDELPHLFVVDKGLTENDTILLEGLSKVRDGDVAHVKFIEPTEALAHLDVPAE